MRLCLDELYTPLIASQLRGLEHDVVSIHDRPALLGTPDRELVALMFAERRAILTENVADFMPVVSRLALAGEEHYGLLLTSDASMPRSRNTIGLFVRTLDRYLREHPSEEALRNRVDWLRPVTRTT
jgi:Domain of unknown function (DUF5615)